MITKAVLLIVASLTAGSLTARAENLLLNSSFKLTTNEVTPDDWDLGHAAGLEFRDLYNQYNLDDNEAGPVVGARVLKITNSLDRFPFLYLLSRITDAKFAAGDYIFSVYVKADRPQMSMDIAPSQGHMDVRFKQKVTTDWQRYSAKFRVDESGPGRLSPLLVLLDRGTYWIAAPQLERGGSMTGYSPSSMDLELGQETPAQRRAALATITEITTTLASQLDSGPRARFEFSAYTDESGARLKVTAGSHPINGVVECATGNDRGSKIFSSRITLGGSQNTVLDIPIGHLYPGEYSCVVASSAHSTVATFYRLNPNPRPVRVNEWRNTIEVDKAPYLIRGIMVGDVVPPEWYFDDIAEHGINTLFYYPRALPDGDFNIRELDEALRLAEKHGLKVIIGPAVMGRQDLTWKPRLDYFADLMRKYRHSTTIIGWFVVDEPRAETLQADDLANLYHRFKEIDPYRLIFINWGSDDVPTRIGAEPFGSLSATDLYSIDYYPFANSDTSMEMFTLRTVRMLLSASLAGRPGHSWLQLYGAPDVSREPTGDELKFMAYVDLLFGGNYSYWTIRSNAKPTWERVGQTDRQVSALFDILWRNEAARQVQSPRVVGDYLYAAWKSGDLGYLVVLHISNRSEHFDFDLKPTFGSNAVEAVTYFDREPEKIVGGTLQDTFDAYGVKVYEIR